MLKLGKKISVIRAELPRTIRILKKSLTFQRFFNTTINQLSLRISNLLGKSFVWGYPYILMVEPTNTCNLRCPLCAYGAGGLSRSKTFLKFEIFQKVINELGKSLFTIMFWNQGEPFLHEEFLQMVNYASKKGIYTFTSTNAHFLENAEEIVLSGLDEIIFSVDGATEEIYIKYRIGGDFNKVLRGIENLANTRRRFNRKKPYLTFQFVITKLNEHQVDESEKLARELGVDEILYKTAEIPPDHSREIYLPENKRYRRYGITAPDDWKQKNNGKNCSELWQQPVLNADGSFAVCCFDKDGMLKIGSMNQYYDFKHLWQDEKFQSIRNMIRENKENIPVCKTCTVKLVRNLKTVVFK